MSPVSVGNALSSRFWIDPQILRSELLDSESRACFVDLTQIPRSYKAEHHDDLQSQSYFSDLKTESDVWDYELRHVPPLQPTHEHSMVLDDGQRCLPWIVDDPMQWESCPQSIDDMDIVEIPKPQLKDTHDIFTDPDCTICLDCGKDFGSYQQLDKHGKRTQHMPYMCTYPGCEKKLQRRDTMMRHIAKHGTPQFSCQYCKQSGVSRSFTRKDHRNTHETKCVFRPAEHVPLKSRRSHASLRNVVRSSSTIVRTTTPAGDAVVKQRIKEFMALMLPHDEVQTRLDNLDSGEMHGLYLSLAKTVLKETAFAETRKIRAVEVSS